MKMEKVYIDGQEIVVEKGTTILNAAKQIGIKIPTLCYLKGLSIKANCRICVVEDEKSGKLYTACSTAVWDGLSVLTNSRKVRETRKIILELLLTDHPKDCLGCVRNGSCELQTLACEYNIREIKFEKGEKQVYIDSSSTNSIGRNPEKCIKCGRCFDACKNVQGIGVLAYANRAEKYTVSTAYSENLDTTSCIYCGQCVAVCPVGALYEKEEIEKVWDAIHNKDIHVVVQPAPAVRVAIGEEFGMKDGTIATGKLVTMLRKIGFDKVFDTNFGADLTIMEEAHEFIHRVKNNGTLPMITSCCPGWITHVEKMAPKIINNLSTCQSPHEMLGAIAKTYYAEKIGIDINKIFVVSIMPCTAKKDEKEKVYIDGTNVKNVDAVLTTRELAKMFKETGIDFMSLDEGEFDSTLGESTGAASIFGVTGGVMEAALRTAYESITGEEIKNVDFISVRGNDLVKEATIKVGDIDVNVAVVNGIKNVKNVIEDIEKGNSKYHFIEVMACPGGCVGGGGQPFGGTAEKINRQKASYTIDKNKSIRKSHENREIKTLYKEYLGKPLSHKAHKLLHTHYEDKSRKCINK